MTMYYKAFHIVLEHWENYIINQLQWLVRVKYTCFIELCWLLSLWTTYSVFYVVWMDYKKNPTDLLLTVIGLYVSSDFNIYCILDKYFATSSFVFWRQKSHISLILTFTWIGRVVLQEIKWQLQMITTILVENPK